MAVALVLAVVLLGPVPAAMAQGCAMCYTSAAAAKKAGVQALQHGILILLVPPLLMFLGIAWLTFRRRGSPEAEDASPAEKLDPTQCSSGHSELHGLVPATLFQKPVASLRIEESEGPTFFRE